MSAAQVAEINRRLRALGITVHEAPGWQTRGTSMDTAFTGGLIHHTATGYGMATPGTSLYNMLFLAGRPDLRPPLCNYAGNEDGSITCGAAGVANHAGMSGGRSMGPLPVATSFNRRVLGLEIVYPGTQPMRGAQYVSACVWARVVADVVGAGDIERVRAHAETSVTGKWDPGYAPGKTIDMAAFRAAAREGADMNEAQNNALSQTWGAVVDGRNWQGSNLQRQLGYVVGQVQAVGAAVIAAVSGGQLDADALAERLAAAAAEAAENAIVSTVLPALREVLEDALGADNTAQADAILARLAERLNPTV